MTQDVLPSESRKAVEPNAWSLRESKFKSKLAFASKLDDTLCDTEISKLGDWGGEVWRTIENKLDDKLFPCIFAKKTNLRKFMMVCCIQSTSKSEDLTYFVNCVDEYIAILDDQYHEDEIRPPLAVFFKPEEPFLTQERYHQLTWELLQHLHQHDSTPWPQKIPADPDDLLWSYCYGGREIFINVTTPVLGKHRSRQLSDSLVFVMQPRHNFDLVAGKNVLNAMAVRQTIRDRSMAYDNIDAISNLGMYGDPNNREWMQYILYDSDEAKPQKCPLHIAKD